MKTFFVSYNKTDREWAEWIAWELEAADYSTVLQAWDFGAGSNFVLEMQKAALETEHTVAVLSPDFLRSAFAGQEWASALASDANAARRKLLPVMVRECESLGLLASYSLISLIGKDDSAARHELLSSVAEAIAIAAGGRAKPLSPPRFPGERSSRHVEAPAFPGTSPRPLTLEPVGPGSTEAPPGRLTQRPRSNDVDSTSLSKKSRKGKLQMSFKDVNEHLLNDSVDIMLENRSQPSKTFLRGVPGSKRIVVSDLESGPGSVYRITIDARSYRSVTRDVALVSAKADVTFTCPIDPRRASVRFPAFKCLPAAIHRLLEESPELLGFEGLAGEKLYDALDDGRKANLFNVAAKSEASALANRRTVLSYFRSLIELRADRCFVSTSRELREEFKNTVVATTAFTTVEGMLHAPRLPPNYSDCTHGGNFRSSDTYGSLQLTFYLNASNTVAEVSLDDGDGLRLLFGVESDSFGGRPFHPFDMHQILIFHQHLDPGYALYV